MKGNDFRKEAEDIRGQLVAWRRDFHRHPELWYREHRAAGIIAETLRHLGYEVQTGIAETGVVGLLRGSEAGPVVMARFDMDALPILEESEVDYASQNPGVMHACGHDAHIAMGLGVATLAAHHRDGLTGALKLVFQPGEEEGSGARRMIEQGVLDDPPPDAFLACHVWNERSVGTIDVSPGAVMAGSGEWTCTVVGKGGHGALPHRAVDPIVAAAQIVSAFQTIVSREISPTESAVVTVGTIHGGEALNVIPARVELGGTVRAFSVATQERILARMRALVDSIAGGFGATAGFELLRSTPPLVNDAAVAALVRAAAEAVVGEANVTSEERTTGSEDAAFFTRRVPSCYFFLGSANAELGLDAPHHNPRFDFDEGVLPIGVATMMETLARYLRQT